jgi:multicomponent Na+:H+ antiporter subunit E
MKAIALLVIWMALWGEVSVANLVSGVVLVGLLAVLFPGTQGYGHRLRPLGALRLVRAVLWSLMVSTWRVALAVLRPTPDRVRAEVVSVPLITRSPLVAAVVANSITLTPGTMTVDVDLTELTIQVHVLGRVDHEEFRRSIVALEQLVIGAVGPGIVR